MLISGQIQGSFEGVRRPVHGCGLELLQQAIAPRPKLARTQVDQCPVLKRGGEVPEQARDVAQIAASKDLTRKNCFMAAAGWVRWCSSTRHGTGHVRWRGWPS